MSKDLRFLLVSGSVRDPSHTRVLIDCIRKHLAQRGVAAVHWDLRRAPLPIADPAFHDDPFRHSDPRVREFAEAAAASDGLVLGSPIYHNSYSGVLKNALDHLTIPCLHLKPVGLASHGGNRSTQAVDHLRIVVRGLLGVAIPTQVCTAADDYQEIHGIEYVIRNPDIVERIDRFTVELVIFVHQLTAVRK